MSRPDYGPLDRALHSLALGPQFLRSATFDLQDNALGKQSVPEVSRPVFIAGLARSGSTMLLNTLYSSGVFRSLTYRDMPFVLMPGLWRRLSGAFHRERDARERAHGDRLLVDFDSPEAFEEVFWRTYCAEKYIAPDTVTPHNPGRVACEKFSRFVQFVLASAPDSRQTRYLGKNNNNLLRMPYLKRVFADADILIPFRKPSQHAASLLRQHRRFCAVHDEDKFSQRYMNWLGHWEFGQDHKHYAFSRQDNPYPPTQIDYWLKGWLDAYRFALANAPEDTLFIGYETLCGAPLPTLETLYDRLGVDADVEAAAAAYEAAQLAPVDDANPGLMAACEDVYAQLQARQLTG